MSTLTLPSQKIVILYETAITTPELKTLNSLLVPILDVQVVNTSSTAAELFMKSGILTVDISQKDLVDWWSMQKSALDTNCKVIYKKNSGKTIDDAKKADIKKAFSAQYIRKYLPTEAKNFLDYLAKVSNDHISSKIAEVSLLRRFGRMIVAIFSMFF